ncbi:MAG: class I SAM-dependent methyltransferase [Halobacteriota archaeon]
MVLGSIYANTLDTGWKDTLLKAYMKVVGTSDLHSHIRYGAFKQYFQPLDNTVEIGAGTGLMTFAFASQVSKHIVGVVYDSNDLEVAKNTLKNSHQERVTFVRGALPHLTLKEGDFDQVLLLDVLEHVSDDVESLRTINKLLKMGGFLVISVPTPNYPKYFGQAFAQKIGHVRDGYTIDTLRDLLTSSGFKIIKWAYYTNALASRLCKFWYRDELSYTLRLIIAPPMILLSKFDPYSSTGFSCSIALLAVKQSEVV